LDGLFDSGVCLGYLGEHKDRKGIYLGNFGFNIKSLLVTFGFKGFFVLYHLLEIAGFKALAVNWLTHVRGGLIYLWQHLWQHLGQ
jgi:hypothetical protein